MGLFKHEPWRLEDVPPIRLWGVDTDIDIGFLGGDEHRNAFASLFRKAFEDNPDELSGATLVSIRSGRGDGLTSLKLPLPLVSAELEPLALRLYDTHNERAVLVLRRSAGLVVLNVAFDNPSFWLSPFAV